MADQNENSSGAQGSDDAAKDERDYVITGEESEAEKDARLAQEAADAQKAKNSKDADDDDDDDADDDEDDDDQSDDDDSGKARKRKRGGFQKKIARLEAEVAELTARLKDQPAKKDDGASKKADDAPPKRPDPKDFKTYDEYTEALTDWKVDEKLRKAEEARQTEAKKSEFKEAQQTKVQRYEKGVEAAQAKYDDFDDVIEDYDGPLTIGMQQALLDSEMGPEVAYHIAQNPKLGEKMAKMTLVQINKEVAKIEARLEAKQGDKAADDDKKTSKSPPPIDPVKGSSKSKKSVEDMDYEEYLKERQKRRGY